MWSSASWRTEIWQELSNPEPPRPWDCLIIGGGITGAGILREATRLGLHALLIEQNDFAYGTSSRSSKLVHGGLRYLKEGRIGLTRASVQERQKLQTAAPGLVDPLGFLFANYKSGGGRKEKFLLHAGLSLYDLLALQWSYRYHDRHAFKMLAPHLYGEDLAGGFQYADAQTDDARLVLRVLREAVSAGATAVNYTTATELIRAENESGQVSGAMLRDEETGQTLPVHARIVINATGAWVDGLRQQLGHEAKIRPLRGSHLILPAWRLPVAQAISFLHPQDGRPVFVFPWEGVTLVGTTDVDHDETLNTEPAISGDEVAYLMHALTHHFPSLNVGVQDIISTFAGVRPVLDTGQTDPSKESRDHVVWLEDGLLTVTGGKLTTFRLIALDVLATLRRIWPELPEPDKDAPPLELVTGVSLPPLLSQETQRRLLGRYGAEAAQVVGCAASPAELLPIPQTTAVWAELRWAARAEGVVHLADLLLRRVRLGLLLPHGGANHSAAIQAIVQPELGWDDDRWAQEWADYLALWQAHYSLPPLETIPAWPAPEARFVKPEPMPAAPRRSRGQVWLIGVGVGVVVSTAVFLFLYLRRHRTQP